MRKLQILFIAMIVTVILVVGCQKQQTIEPPVADVPSSTAPPPIPEPPASEIEQAEQEVSEIGAEDLEGAETEVDDLIVP